MRKTFATHQREVARLDRDIARLRRGLADDEAHLETLTRRRRLRRPDRHAIDTTQQRIDAQSRDLERLQKDRARAAADLERNRSRLRDAGRTVNRIPDVEAAIQRRRHWLLSHPGELAWEAELAARFAGTGKTVEAPTPDHEHDEFAWWPADVKQWPAEADQPLRRMGTLLSPA